MKIIYSEQHRLHAPRGELSGGEWVSPFESPDRWDFIVARLRDRGYDDFSEPEELDPSLVREIHDPVYVDFLETAFDQWTAEGFRGDAMPIVFPATAALPNPLRMRVA